MPEGTSCLPNQPCTALLDTYPLFLTAWTCENLVAIAMASILRAGTVLLASKMKIRGRGY